MTEPKLTGDINRSKIGCWAWSKAPGKYCHSNSKYCYKYCYAVRPMYQYPSVRKMWGDNGQLMKEDPGGTIAKIYEQLSSKRNVEYFRIHVSGDLCNQVEYEAWVWLIDQMPDTKFLLYTKNTDIDFTHRPDNLAIYVSQSPKAPILKLKGYPDAPSTWLVGDKPRRIGIKNYPGDDTLRARGSSGETFGFTCPGDCKECRECWKGHKDIVFNIH